MGASQAADVRAPGSVEAGQPPSASAMRELRRLHAAAVTAVTYPAERVFRGITVTAFAVVSLAPARVLICVDTSSEALRHIEAAKGFAVNLPSDRQEFLADQFAGRAPLVNRRFEGVPHRVTALGNPVLLDAVAWFDCAVATVVSGGDHDVVLGDVREAGFGSGTAPLLYYDGRYSELAT